MIATDFAYLRPDTLAEISEAIAYARRGAGQFLFYGGGSEIISMARLGSIAPAYVIDIKAVPEARALALNNGVLTLGAALTLAEIAESDLFPLMSATVARIADHTNQCRITLGGNIAGTIAYREAVLPLLLADARVNTLKGGKLARAELARAFDKRVMRAPDEAVISFEVDEKYLSMPYAHAKRTRGEKIDYPLVTLAALKAPEGLRFALSGVLGYPFRLARLERIFSDACQSAGARAEAIIRNLPEPPVSDILAQSDFRAFQAKRALADAINRLEGG